MLRLRLSMTSTCHRKARSELPTYREIATLRGDLPVGRQEIALVAGARKQSQRRIPRLLLVILSANEGSSPFFCEMLRLRLSMTSTCHRKARSELPTYREIATLALAMTNPASFTCHPECQRRIFSFVRCFACGSAWQALFIAKHAANFPHIGRSPRCARDDESRVFYVVILVPTKDLLSFFVRCFACGSA